MQSKQKKIAMSVRHYPDDYKYNVRDIWLGDLVGGLTEEPDRLSRITDQDGQLKIEIQRKHEWEYVLGLIMIGSGIFMKNMIATLGKRLGNWIADWAEKKLIDDHVEIRVGKKSIKIDPANPIDTREDLTKLLESAANRGVKINVLFPW